MDQAVLDRVNHGPALIVWRRMILEIPTQFRASAVVPNAEAFRDHERDRSRFCISVTTFYIINQRVKLRLRQ
jgi:hypothetical protein